MPSKVFEDLFKYMHLNILTFVFVAQVFHANAVYKVPVTAKELANTEIIP